MQLEELSNISDNLALMPDPALQQFAQMHKEDPYMVSLALSESNRRKKLRTAAQGQAGGMPQPKVVDAAIQGMAPAPTRVAQTALPENQGIGALPAPNMRGLADGGIAGYSDEDEGMADGGMSGMFDFAQRSEPVLRMSGGGQVPRYNEQGLVRLPNESFAEFRRRVFEAELQAERDRNAKEKELKEAERLQLLANRGEGKMVPPSPFFDRTPLAVSGETSAANPASASAAAPSTGPIVPYGQTKIPLVQGNQPPAPPSAPTTQQGLGSLPSAGKVMTAEQAKAQAGDFVDFEDARTALKKAATDQESQGARMRTMLADSLPKTPALQGLEKLLDKQDAETGGEKDKAAGLALLSAGLAIAGGSSQFALQNLKEAIPAVAQYGEALKDIKKMERENMKMRGEIEQARRAESRDDTKLKLQLEEKIGERQDKINELGIGLTSKIAGTTAEVASKLWTTSYEAVNRKEVAGISALAGANAELNKYAQIGAADPNSALAKGFQMYKQEGAEPRLYGEYIKLSRDPVDGTAFREKYPTFDIFKAGYSGSSMQFAAPPPSASILKPPKG